MSIVTASLLSDLNTRSREVFRRVVESYLATGEPVGSRSIAGSMPERVSPATIRSTMNDLERLGLLDHPHISAGRQPTQMGLRLFVDALMETGPVTADDRAALEATLGAGRHGDAGALLDSVGAALSRLTQGASLVLTPKQEAPIRHVEFVSLAPDRALVVLVFADGRVENRLFTPPPGQTPFSLREAGNFINAHAEGRTLSELAGHIAAQIAKARSDLDTLAAEMVTSGIALWDQSTPEPRLIVRGQANLLDENAADLDRVRRLFDDLEHKRDIAAFLELAEEAEGVRIFIGAENTLFSLSGSSLVVSPYMTADRRIVGAVGVIGPTRLNYGRIVPLVDLTAQLVGRALSGRKG